MPHIHTEHGQHDHTVSIYLFRTDFDEPKVMLHTHLKMKVLAQFGGHIELTETPWQAAIHELKEETGYAMEDVSILQPVDRLESVDGAIVHPSPVVNVTMGSFGSVTHFHTDTTYAFIANGPAIESPQEGESTEMRLLTRGELIELGNENIDKVTYDIALYIFDKILPTWKKVDSLRFK